MAAKKNVNVNTEELVENATETVKKAAKTTRKKAAKAVEEVKEGVAEAKKTVARKKTVKGSVLLQFMGREIATETLLERTKEIWVQELGRTASSFKEAKVYVKPEEGMAYYVINDEVSGGFTL